MHLVQNPRTLDQIDLGVEHFHFDKVKQWHARLRPGPVHQRPHLENARQKHVDVEEQIVYEAIGAGKQMANTQFRVAVTNLPR